MYKTIAVIAVLTSIYMFFVFQGIKKRYAVKDIQEILLAFGIKPKDPLMDSFELFKIGIGIK